MAGLKQIIMNRGVVVYSFLYPRINFLVQILLFLGTDTAGYNRWRFLLESLEDLDKQFQKHGGRLYVFRGDPVDIFKKLFQVGLVNSNMCKICAVDQIYVASTSSEYRK